MLFRYTCLRETPAVATLGSRRIWFERFDGLDGMPSGQSVRWTQPQRLLSFSVFYHLLTRLNP